MVDIEIKLLPLIYLMLQYLQNFYGLVAFDLHRQKHSTIPYMADVKWNVMILKVLQLLR